MSRDANQIAQEASRREGTSSFRESLQPPRPVGLRNDAPKPKRGTFTVWKDGTTNFPPSTTFHDVTVRLDTPGAVILGSEEGSTYLLYPEPGWYCEFIPNDEGE